MKENGGARMSELITQLSSMDLNPERSSKEVNKEIARILGAAGYRIALFDYDKPWGGFNQLDNNDADAFVAEFFPGLSLEEARLGNAESPLSPKILGVSPSERLSWQLHGRRAERWRFLTPGGYYKSVTDEQGDLQQAAAGDIVQFSRSERHRLVGNLGGFTLVAEIWQHTNPAQLSDEEDIIRLEDDYKR